MSTIHKTTVRRFNGVDWDSIHFSTSGDIVSLGTATQLEGSDSGFTVGDNLNATDTLTALMTRVINRMATLDTTVIPDLKAGGSIESLDATKLTGTVKRENLPVDVSGKGLEVESELAKDALLYTQVNQGDIVKVTGGAVYLVTKSDPESVTYMPLADDAAKIAWNRITNAPTTLAGYGITDAVHSTNDVASTGGAGAANKVVKANAEGKLAFDVTGDAGTLGGHAASYFATAEAFNTLNDTVTNASTGLSKRVADVETGMQNIDASQIKTGVLDISLIPKAAIERMHVVQSEGDLASLTTEQVQDGDTVKIADKDGVIGKMYYVTDSTKLGTEDYMQGLMPYSAGTASAVDWSGVQQKPTTLSGYGITDAIASNMMVTEASPSNQGKILVLDSNGKLPVSITGDATTLEGHAASYFATAEAFNAHVQAYNGTVETVSEIAAIVLGDESGEGETVVTRVQKLENTVGSAEAAGSILYNIAQLQAGTGISALAASKLTGRVSYDNLPEDVKAWEAITGKPTTLSGYGITDAVNVSMLVDTATPENQGKILKINAEGKLNASITGDAATLGGHAASYFATAKSVADLSLNVPVMVESLEEVADAKVGQMVMLKI